MDSALCATCGEPCDVETACGHAVHDACLLKWYRARGRGPNGRGEPWICPVCRADVPDETARVMCGRELYRHLSEAGPGDGGLDALKCLVMTSDMERTTPGGFFGQLWRARLFGMLEYRRRHPAGAPEPASDVTKPRRLE